MSVCVPGSGWADEVLSVGFLTVRFKLRGVATLGPLRRHDDREKQNISNEPPIF